MITAYAAADGQGDDLVVPTVDTYTAAGVTGVTDANLAAVNAAVAAVDGTDADSTAEVQTLADGAIDALKPVNPDAGGGAEGGETGGGDSGGDGDTGDGDMTGGGDGGDGDAGADPDGSETGGGTDGGDPDTGGPDPAVPDPVATALGVISAWATDDTSNPAPSVETYAAAGVTGVTDANLAAVNAAVAAVDGAAADSTAEVQTLADGAIDALKPVNPDAGGGAEGGETGGGDGGDGDAGGDPDGSETGGGTEGGDPDTGGPDPAVPDPAAAALGVISTYADGGGTAPTVETYADAGVTGVTESNLAAVNAVLALAEREAVDETSEVQGLVDGVIADLADAARRTALSELQFHAEFSGGAGTDPSLETYADAGVTGVTQDNLAAVNAAIASASGLPAVRAAIAAADGDPDAAADPDFAAAVAEIQTLADGAIAAGVIADWAADSTEPSLAPSLETYTTAGVTGVTAANLAAVNAVLALAEREAADETSEVQGLVDGAIADLADAARRTALSELQFHAEFSGAAGTDPSLETYADAGVTGVTQDNLAAVNAAIASASGLPAVRAAIAAADGDPDAAADPDFAAAVAEIQTLADGAIAAGVIADWAADSTEPSLAPSLETYTTAGVTGVTESNLAAVNAVLALAEREAADETSEVQGLVDGAIADLADAARRTALSELQFHAEFSGAAGTDPSLETYADAGVTGVTQDNLAAVNAAIASASGLPAVRAAIAAADGDPDAAADPDFAAAVAEIQTLADGAIAAGVIADWAADSTEPSLAPSLETYTTAGVTGVTESNLAAVNAVLALADRDAANETSEVQGLVDGAIADLADAARRTALSELQFHAEFSGGAGTDPSLETYADAGVTGVTQDNLAAVNAAIASASGLPAVRAAIAAADGDPDAAAEPDFAAAVAEIQTLVDPAIAAVAASLATIAAYAADREANPAPGVDDYAAAGVTGVTADNVATVNAAVAAVGGDDADTTAEVQALVDPAIAAVAAAGVIIDYAADATNRAPTVDDFAALFFPTFSGVTEANLAAVNAALVAAEAASADSIDDIALIVVDTIPRHALGVIAGWAADSTGIGAVEPTAADYETAIGLFGLVTDADLAVLNTAVAAAGVDAVDTADEVAALVAGTISGRALGVIAAWAADSTGSGAVEPTAADYETATGLFGLVTDANLAAVNAAVAALDRDGVDSASDIADVINGVVATAASGALAVIMAWAADSTRADTAPTVDDYAALFFPGISEVTDANLAAVNAAVAAVDADAADSVFGVQVIATGAIAALAALDVISAWAADETANPAPTAETYTAAGVIGVTDASLDAVNAAVAAADRDGADSASDIQTIADPVLAEAAREAALGVISAWARDSSNADAAPTVADYTAVFFPFPGSVTLANLAVVNAAVAAAEGNDADSASEIRTLIDGAFADRVDQALILIERYSAGSAALPTVDTYATAGVVGVTQANLDAVNAVVANRYLDGVSEIQARVDPVIAVIAALGVITDYAADDTNAAPMVDDYAVAGVTGVTDANLAAVNAAVADADREDADRADEIQALVNQGALVARAVDLIASWAADNTGADAVAPTVADYTDALQQVNVVTLANIAAVNAAVAAVDREDADSAAKIQALLDPVIERVAPLETAALKTIADYVAEPNNTAPTAADYAAAGVTGVTAANLAAVNVALAALGADAVNSAAKLQSFVIGGNEAGETGVITERLAGGAGDNTLLGLGGNDALEGGDGNDVLTGGAGADALDGGAGADTAAYRSSAAAVTVNLATGTGSGGDAEGDTLVNIERLEGSDHDDILTGDDAANTLLGAGGSDTLEGGDGNDVLTGGAGADALDGGAGSDTAAYRSSAAAVTVNLADGTGSGGQRWRCRGGYSGQHRTP